MNRKLIMTLHLYLAALFTPVMLILAASGGLYLFGYKGEMEKGTPVFVDKVSLFDETGNTHDRVKNLLVEVGLDDDFEYIKQRGKKIQTRPTSRDHYEITEHKGGVKIVPVSPDLQASMLELHKGHGPKIFKTLEKVVAVGLFLILFTGLVIGLMSPLFKKPTVIISFMGIIIFVLAAAL